MPQPRYRIRLPDGQRFDATGSPAKIRRVHPSAVITHRVEHDAAGNAQLVPFTGKSAEPPEDDNEGYGALTVAQLRAEIEGRGLDAPSGAKKADLVLILESSDVPPSESNLDTQVEEKAPAA